MAACGLERSMAAYDGGFVVYVHAALKLRTRQLYVMIPADFAFSVIIYRIGLKNVKVADSTSLEGQVPFFCFFSCLPRCAKTAERIDVLFGIGTLGDPRLIVSDGVSMRREGSMRPLPNYFGFLLLVKIECTWACYASTKLLIKLYPREAQTCALPLLCDRDLEINPMTLKLEGDLDIPKTYLHTENEAPGIQNGELSWRNTKMYTGVRGQICNASTNHF